MALTEILIFRKIKGNTMNITEFTIQELAKSIKDLKKGR